MFFVSFAPQVPILSWSELGPIPDSMNIRKVVVICYALSLLWRHYLITLQYPVVTIYGSFNKNCQERIGSNHTDPARCNCVRCHCLFYSISSDMLWS